MSVYVDPLFNTPKMRNWPYKRACHMFADTLRELHEMAGLIGLSRSWFQARHDFPHYDLTAWKRNQAIERGAPSPSIGSLLLIFAEGGKRSEKNIHEGHEEHEGERASVVAGTAETR